MNIRKINSYYVYIHTVNALMRVCELQPCLNTIFSPCMPSIFFLKNDHGIFSVVCSKGQGKHQQVQQKIDNYIQK